MEGRVPNVGAGTAGRRARFWPFLLGALAAGVGAAIAFWMLAELPTAIILIAFAAAGGAVVSAVGLLIDAVLPFEVSAKIDRVTYLAFALASLLGAAVCVYTGFATGKLADLAEAIPLAAFALFFLRRRDRQKSFALVCAAIGAFLLISVLSHPNWLGPFLAVIAFVAAIAFWRSDPEAWPWLT